MRSAPVHGPKADRRALAVSCTGLAVPLGLDPAVPDQAALIDAIRAKLEGTPRWRYSSLTTPLDPYLPRLGTPGTSSSPRVRQHWGDGVPIWVRGIPKKEAEEKAMFYLNRLRIPEQANKYPGQLSGGQQQRLAIARAPTSSSIRPL